MHADTTQPVAHTAAAASAETLLERWIGLDAQTVGSAAFARAVRVRMVACGAPDEAAFLGLLASDAAEQGRFIDEVVVPESWFFRDSQVFDALREYAAMFAASGRLAPLRILCVPCAAGEEPYSVAIALFDAGLSAAQFSIDAADVSHAALARAAAATYSENAFRDSNIGSRNRWFRARGAFAELDETVRAQVRFSRNNLLDESFAAERQPYDIVFCRNLLIYLTRDARSRAERVLDRLLAPNGLLMLGAAEPPILKGGWRPASRTSTCVLQRGTRPDALPGTAPLQRSGVKADSIARSLNQLAAAAPAGGPWPANGPVESAADKPAPGRQPTGDELLRTAQELADAGRRVEALEACIRYQQTAGPSARLFFLMGMLYQATGDLERAEAFLHKTLYMDPDHDEAILSLALVAMQRGDAPMAEHYRQSAARVQSRKGAP
jgi:chemotaxis protein methyltransferase WspC